MICNWAKWNGIRIHLPPKMITSIVSAIINQPYKLMVSIPLRFIDGEPSAAVEGSSGCVRAPGILGRALHFVEACSDLSPNSRPKAPTTLWRGQGRSGVIQCGLRESLNWPLMMFPSRWNPFFWGIFFGDFHEFSWTPRLITGKPHHSRKII